MPGFSPQAITALVQVVTGGEGSGSGGSRIGHYRKGTELEMFFGNFGLELTLRLTSRMQAVRNMLTQANQGPDAVRVLTPIFEAAVNPFDFANDPAGKHPEALDYLNKALRTDGRELVEARGRYRLLAIGATSAAAEAVMDSAEALTLDTVRRDMERALASVETDAEDSITSACSMLESVCRTIILDRGGTLPAKRDVSHLYEAAAKLLDLSPGRADLADDLRAILGGLNTVAKGIGALRTHGGDAHGREKGLPRPDTRLARLAIHAASAVTEFLIETWQRQRRASEPKP